MPMRAILKSSISLALVAIALYMLDFSLLGETVRQGDLVQFFFAIAVILVMYLFLAVRWQLMTGSIMGQSLLGSAAIYFKATFLNTFTPANLGGDAYRLVVLKGGPIPTGELLKLLLRERILGLYGYVIVFVVAYALSVMSRDGGGAVSASNPYSYGLAVAAAVFSLPIVARPLGGRIAAAARAIIGKERLPGLEGWVDALAGLLSPKGTLWLMSLTFLGILLWVLSIQIIASGFGLVVPTLHLAAVAALVELIRLVPVTVQGIGLREGAFAYLLSFWGHNPEQCYVVGLAAYLALSVSIVLCGPIGKALIWQGAEKDKA